MFISDFAIKRPVITVVSIVVQLAANRYTPRITDMFFRDRTNLAVMGFFVVACIDAVWVSLAVSRDYAGRGLGTDLLSDALRRIAVASRSIGIGAVLVHAKDDAAKGFYLACAEFIEYPADSRTLFLPIETVIAAFG